MPIFSSSVRPKCDISATGYKSFTLHLSQDRLASVQSLIGQDEVLLVVCGIDSQFSQGSQQIFNYLLFNVTHKRAAEIERTKIDDEHFDDVVLAIYKSSAVVFLNPVNYWFYLPYVACWPDVEIHCAQDHLFDDQDAMEEFKMKFLVQAVANCKSICVAYYGKDHLPESSGFSPMLIEKWPLIQAYAIDGFGVGTFFTLKHQVRDISQEVQAVMQSVDPVAIEDLTDKALKAFTHQFDSTFQAFDFLAGRNDPTLLTTDKSMDQLMEPFRSYSKHALGGDPANSRQTTTVAYLAFDTRRSALRQLAKANLDVNKPFGPLPSAFIIHAEDRSHSLVCTRTGFLHWQLSHGDKLQEELNAYNRDLDHVYSRMSEIIRAKMRTICAADNFGSLSKDISVELSEQLGIPESLLEVTTDLLQPTGQLPAGSKAVPHLRSVSCFVHDLTPEALDESRWCGSVGLTDTYFVSCDGSQILTEQIPTACHWTGDCAALVRQRLTAAPDDDRLADLLATVEATGAEVTCVCMRRQLLLFNSRECSPLLAPRAVRLLASGGVGGGGGDSLDQPCRLAVTVDAADEAAPQLPPPHLLTTPSGGHGLLQLRLAPGGRSKRDFFAKVAPIWHSEGLLKAAEADAQAEEAAVEVAETVSDEAEEAVAAAATAGAILVWGHLGSYAETVAHELASADGSRPLVDLLHCAGVAEAASALATAWQQQSSCCSVVLCPHLVSPQALLAACAAANVTACVASVIVCVNSVTAVMSGRCQLQFGALPCMADGACSVLLLTADAVSEEAGPAEAEVTRLFRLVNQNSAKLVRAPAGRLPQSASSALMLPPEVPAWRQLQRRLRQPSPVVAAAAATAFQLPAGLTRASVEFSRPLDRDRLAERLKSMRQKFFCGGEAAGGGVDEAPKFFYLSGTALVKKAGGVSELQLLHFWHHCPTDTGAWLMKQRRPAAAASSSVSRVVAFGYRIDAEDLKRLLRLCAPLRPTRKALMIRADLTPAAIARIHKERHLDPLPEGWFFNGTKYISFDGESSKTHPRMEQFLEAFIAEENKKITDFNAKQGDTDWQDLFAS